MSFLRLPSFLQKLICASALLLGGINAANAQAYWTGSSFTSTSGGNYIPWGWGTSASYSGINEAQFLYTPSDFNTTPPSGNITTIYIKPYLVGFTSGTYTYTNLVIKMGMTTLTGLTSGTWNTGLTTVYSNSNASFSMTTGSWFPIALQTTFPYTGGNMIIEISHQNSGNGIVATYDLTYSSNRRMYGSSTSSTSTGASTNCELFGFDLSTACNATPTQDTVKTAAMSPASPICAGSTKSLTSSTANFTTGIGYQWQQSLPPPAHGRT